MHRLGAGLCVVGDDDQTIYQWRGSSTDYILKFQERYREVKQIRLETNFRSSEGVITMARGFINRLKPRLQKEMRYNGRQPRDRGQDYEEGDIVALRFDSPEEEAEYIAETIKALRGVAFNDGAGERGLSWSDMVIILRSVRHNGAVIKKALKEADIPFIVSGRSNLFETAEACAARSLFLLYCWRVHPTSTDRR